MGSENGLGARHSVSTVLGLHGRLRDRSTMNGLDGKEKPN